MKSPMPKVLGYSMRDKPGKTGVSIEANNM